MSRCRIFMVGRTVFCALLFLAPLIYAQDDPLERPASNFRSSDVGLTETLLKFSHEQKLRIALEYVDRESLNEPITLDLRDMTIRQGLDAILLNGRGYSWQFHSGIVEITNRRRSKRADEQLNMVIPVFRISANESAKMASTMLWWNLQTVLDPSLNGFAGDILEGAETSKVNPATLHNRTVRGLLTYIVVNSRAEGWIAAGPPECLGLTPNCGLWLLVETPLSNPDYRPLLDTIRHGLRVYRSR